MILGTFLIVTGLCAALVILLHLHPPTLLTISLGTIAIVSVASFASGDVPGGVTYAVLDLILGWLAFSICRLTRTPTRAER